jgi:PhnB protein
MAMLAPMLSVRGGKQALTFYADAFGASATVHAEDDEGRVVAELKIGDADFWIADESRENSNFAPDSLGGSTARLLLVVDDPDAAVEQALRAGARTVWPVRESHGWRIGRVRDPFGHHWEIGCKIV